MIDGDDDDDDKDKTQPNTQWRKHNRIHANQHYQIGSMEKRERGREKEI